jgi:small-conductance mechanosensitive channel/CRP-like cAMP-binding protein
MIPSPETVTEKLIALAVAVPVFYWIAVAIGRFLKRRAGVTLGVMYRFFCAAIALYLPLKILALDYKLDSFDLRRELRAAAILLGALFASALIHRYVWDGYFLEKKKTKIPKFLRELAALVLFAIAAVFVLDHIYGEGHAFAGLLAGSGVAAIILGFAMQDLLGNIISGIALSIGKPFKPGDWLMFDNNHAEVIEVNWRSTRLLTNDHTTLDIPNNQIVRHTIVNLSYPTKAHAMRITVGIDYDVPPNRVKEIIVGAAKESLGVLPRPEPKCFLKEFADSAMQYELKFWMEDDALFNDIFDSIRTNIWYALKRNGIKIPFPIRTVQIERNVPKSSAIPDTVRDSLRRQAFFQCLDDGETERLLASAKLSRYGGGEKLIEQGTPGLSMFVLANGTANVLVNHNGEATHVAMLRAGDYFGEMSLLTGEYRTATVVAQGDCDVLEIGKAAFSGLLQSNGELSKKLSEMLAQRRLETEGVLATTAERKTILTKKQEYSAKFLARLNSFFEL